MKINFKKRSESFRDAEQEQGFSLEYLLQTKAADEKEAEARVEQVNVVEHHMPCDTKASESLLGTTRYLESSSIAPSYISEEQIPSASFEAMIKAEQGFESPFCEPAMNTCESPFCEPAMHTYESQFEQSSNHTYDSQFEQSSNYAYDPQFDEEAWAEITKFATELPDVEEISHMHKRLLDEVSEQQKTAYVSGEAIKINKESSSWEG